MKFLFTFLGFFMMYLSCLPCGDGVECNTNAVAKISAAIDHHEHEHSKEVCTPFCTCTCCAVTVFYSAGSPIKAAQTECSSGKYPLFNMAIYTEVYDKIWQPPKIA